METRICGDGIECPHCKKGIKVIFEHTMEDKHLDEIQDSLWFDTF